MEPESETRSLQATWTAATSALRSGLVQAFDQLGARAGLARDLLRHRPALVGSALVDPPRRTWTALEVLEHVSLTDRYLLILAEKIAAKSSARAARGAAWPVHAPRFDHLAQLADRELQWHAPQHMVPTGAVTATEVEERLAEDRRRAERLLDEAPSGVGTLHRIRMSVVGGDDDRLDLYQYLEVLRLHAVRHLSQIDRAIVSARASSE